MEYLIHDRGMCKEKEFGFGRLNMDGPITRARRKRLQKEFAKRLNSLKKKEKKKQSA